ncbi:vWA domain-containing protein [Rhabdothermincola salaria]|uniref:vWA domain-containing protein n=1 Tax=Rhabdothermincola salaria TaxID=2903142 RepID=UPI001E4DFD3E|nr:vWA domain-containing protein [Rhabdothermincola salaria]MCD9624417.1 VWA domain-containing protein [Rhabdothermincola salaria]
MADLTGATDERLRARARRLAGRLAVDLGRTGPVRRRGVGRLREVPADRGTADLDLDRSLDALLSARSRGESPHLADLRARDWGRPDLAVSLVVDRSGSMGGERLATAAIAAAATVLRAPTDSSVLAFSDRVIVVAPQGSLRPVDAVVDDLLCLRGHGPTDLALALRAARHQLERSDARRRVAVVLSDARPTAGGDPARDAAALDELVIVAPADDHADARDLAEAVGARWLTLTGPSAVPQVMTDAFAG